MAVDSCVFCEILAGESPASRVYEDQRVPWFSGDGLGFRFDPGYFRPTSRAAPDEGTAAIRQVLGGLCR
jgi:diadenosine tetraphosphate (Ap4A) HIT family hydrolase